ncbi:hypothetical protein LOTGIDRAFT_238194 [Lottia gigantea]|uniref:ZP domain-containing protein n=1 Tax=Lottia gigantea TaxID=225164 RepID=V4ACI9_LOTGI|nr:hypothetical protein LOTGIDRAFT_238194 [Lottia gigantea]ESP01724.1 hypothetical protein LOTGIDRAFT_238194 [Lottia gigantea]
MCKSRCFLFLLWSIVVVTYCKDVKKKPKCEIVKPYQSDYVSADLTKLIKGKGCSTNNTTPNKQAVHVVNLKVKDDQLTDGKRTKVNLRIEQLHSQNNDLDVYYVDYGRPLVFVLNSDKPVKWRVELSRIGQSVNIKHLFVVPSHSSIRFKKTMIRVRGKKMSLQNYDNKTDLVRWAKRKYKAVTTYSEVDGTNLIFRVGIEKDAGSKCDLSQLEESQHILTSHKLHQTITGCTTQGRKHYLTKPVFIIELKHAPQSDIPESIVDLDITSFNNEPLNKDFYLILKSPANIKWRIRSWKIQGSINIVTDAESNLKGIRMQTVASRREVMSSSGEKLIQWAEKYIAAVESYTAIDVANKIKLQLGSEKDVRGGPIQPKPPTNDDDLRDIIHTDCSRGQFTVIFPNYLLQEWALVKEQITLLDRRCTAKQNSTHIILQSSLNDCMTKHIQVDDNLRYSNAIVIHAAVDTDSFLEDLGSGYIEPSDMSGGGSNANTYMDDEDFTSRKVEIDVQCEQPKVDIKTEKPVVMIPDTKGYRLELYSSEYYNDDITTPPIEIKNKQRIYIEASIASDIPVKVQVEDCWLSPSKLSETDNKIGTEQHQLITHGCAKDPNIKWQNLNAGGHGKKFEHLMPYSRFSFPIRDHFNGQETYLYCQLSQCQMHFLDSINIPKCPSSRGQEKCNKHLPPGLNTLPIHQTVNYQLLSIGPISIINTDDSDNSISGDQTGSGVEDNQQPHSVIIEGLDSATVVGIAFAAFAIGILLTGTLWFIHTHTGSSKHVLSSHGSTETTGELSPNTQVPISA